MNKFREVVGATLCIALLVMGGCSALAGLWANGAGSPPVEARYVPKNAKTLVLAEHAPGASADDISTEDIGRRVESEWHQHLLLAPLVSSATIESLKLKTGTKFHSMSIADVGRAVGAEQVLYIDVVDAQVEPTGEMIRGKANVRAKIVDVASGQTLWPQGASIGLPIDAESEYTAKGDGVHESTVLEETRQVIAEDLVRLFYKSSTEH